jgi:hypothetical protein
MKHVMICTLAAALIGGQGVAQAQDSKPADKPAPAAGQPARPDRPPGQRQAGGDRMKMLAEQLKLTTEQQDKLRPIFAEETKKARELREDTALAPEQRREKMGKIREETRKKVKDAKILSDEQWKKWEEILAQQRNRGGQGGQGRQGGQGGQQRPPAN